MSSTSKIEWTDATWNPIRFRNQNGKVGHYCEKVSPGCAHCYAERMQPRFGNRIRYNAADLSKGNVFLDEKVLMQPLRWKKPRMIFVCSMSDLFGEFVDDETIDRVFSIMGECRSHTFQVLTKRPERMAEYLNGKIQVGKRIRSRAEQLVYVPLEIPLSNVWPGTSVEDQQRADERIPHLLRCPAVVRFLSCEPLLGPIDLGKAKALPVYQEAETVTDRCMSFDDAGKPICTNEVQRRGLGWRRHDGNMQPWIDWVIVGGESGPKARPMNPDWARSIRDQCRAAGVAFFHKQNGEWTGFGDLALRVGKKKSGRLLDGREWNEMPNHATNKNNPAVATA